MDRDSTVRQPAGEAPQVPEALRDLPCSHCGQSLVVGLYVGAPECPPAWEITCCGHRLVVSAKLFDTFVATDARAFVVRELSRCGCHDGGPRS